jgi:hypothetical protein
MALPVHVGLVSEESSIELAELTQVAAALQKQVLRDFDPIWRVSADVSAFPTLESLPLDYWPIIIKDDIGAAGAAGYHADENGQPFSLVQYSGDWTLTASHELLEMLGDPFGRRLVAGDSLRPDQGRVQYLVEVCDPSEATEFSYRINGLVVSDFYTPHFFDPQPSTGVRYSYTGAITAPRQVLKGGYLSWHVPATNDWWQRTWFGGANPVDRNLGQITARDGNLRRAIDRLTAKDRLEHMKVEPVGMPTAMMAAAAGTPSFDARARALRQCVSTIIAEAT